MIENEVIRFSNKICILRGKNVMRKSNCKECNEFDKCNEIWNNRLNEMKNRVKEVNKNKGFMSFFDFQLQFRDK